MLPGERRGRLRRVHGGNESLHNRPDGVMDMYQWYFGDREPEDKREALLHIALGIVGFAALCIGWALLMILWFKGLV